MPAVRDAMRRLTDLRRQSVAESKSAPGDLEQRLLAQFDARAQPVVRPRRRLRVALAAFTVLSLIVAACMPMQYEVPLGLNLRFSAEDTTAVARVPVHALVTMLRDETPARDITIERSQGDQQAELLIQVWGSELATGQLVELVQQRFPSTRSLDFKEEAMATSRRTIVARHLWRSVFDSSGLSAEAEQHVVEVIEQLRHGVVGAEGAGVAGVAEVEFEVETSRHGDETSRLRRGHPPHRHQVVILRVDEGGEETIEIEKLEVDGTGRELPSGLKPAEGNRPRREILRLIEEEGPH